MTRGPVDLSVIIPAYDEGENLRELIAALERERAGKRWEYIVVDDGSTDRTREVLRVLAAETPSLRVVRLRRNFGKSAALQAGFDRARGPWMATLDADLQDDPAELGRLVEAHVLSSDPPDVIVGWRRKRRDPWTKICASRMFNALVSVATRVRVRDLNSSLKILRADVGGELALYPGYHRFIPLLARWRGYRVLEVPVAHRRRAAGRSHYGAERLFQGLFDLAALLFLSRFHHRPGRFFAGIGTLFLVVGGVIGAYLVGRHLAYGKIGFRYPLLALGVFLLVAGIQFIGIGLLGELIAGGFAQGKRIYTVEEELDHGTEEQDPPGEGGS